MTKGRGWKMTVCDKCGQSQEIPPFCTCQGWDLPEHPRSEVEVVPASELDALRAERDELANEAQVHGDNIASLKGMLEAVEAARSALQDTAQEERSPVDDWPEVDLEPDTETS